MLALGLSACGPNPAQSKVALRFGSLIGMEAAIAGESQLQRIDYSVFARLVSDEENFLLIVRGSSQGCTCFQEWHDEVLSPYIKRNKLLVRIISLDEFRTGNQNKASDPEDPLHEKAKNQFGVNLVDSSETLCVFRGGELAYQHTNADLDSDWVKKYSVFSEWMNQRIELPRIYYVDEAILDSYYEGNAQFTVYFGRDTCGDCRYLGKTALRRYLDANNVEDGIFLYIDFDQWRGTDAYQEKKDKYGLSQSEKNPAGYETGVFPTLYSVNPDNGRKTGDVIESAAVFYNESVKDNVVSGSYFTQERLNDASANYLYYLKESSVQTKVLEGLTLPESEASRHERLASYEEPIFQAFLDATVKA